MSTRRAVRVSGSRVTRGAWGCPWAGGSVVQTSLHGHSGEPVSWPRWARQRLGLAGTCANAACLSPRPAGKLPGPRAGRSPRAPHWPALQARPVAPLPPSGAVRGSRARRPAWGATGGVSLWPRDPRAADGCGGACRPGVSARLRWLLPPTHPCGDVQMGSSPSVPAGV